jgi:hypothetical protein
MRFNIENLKEIRKLVKELAVGLRRLAFKDNFEGFEVDITIPASSTISVRNQLPFIPSRYIILSQMGNGLVTKSTIAWTLDFLYFHNNGAAEVTVKIFVMR